jgi:DNA-directed RNA polymerase specialized sigma24 family protein
MRKKHLVNIPRETYLELRKVYKLEQLHDKLTPELIASELKVPPQRAIELYRAWCAKQAANTPLDAIVDGTKGITVEETLADPDTNVEGEALEAVTREERQELWDAVQALRPLERVTISLNMGIVPFEGATVADVERAACVSRQHRVRQKLAKLFREGYKDARRLGFLPEDATGKRPPGGRVVDTLSGHRGRA